MKEQLEAAVRNNAKKASSFGNISSNVWMLKQVQHDEVLCLLSTPPPSSRALA